MNIPKPPAAAGTKVEKQPRGLGRITKDYQRTINEDGGDTGVVLGPVNSDNLFKWRAYMWGPPDTPYANIAFPLDIVFDPNMYPIDPPKVKFVYPIWHVNVYNQSGDICLDMLKKDRWTPALTPISLMVAVRSLLMDGNAESPANSVAGQEWLKHIGPSGVDPKSKKNCYCGTICTYGAHVMERVETMYKDSRYWSELEAFLKERYPADVFEDMKARKFNTVPPSRKTLPVVASSSSCSSSSSAAVAPAVPSTSSTGGGAVPMSVDTPLPSGVAATTTTTAFSSAAVVRSSAPSQLQQERRTEPAPLVFRSARPHVPVLPSPLPSLSAGLPAVEVGGSKGVEVKAAEFKLDRSADPVATAYTPTSALTASYGSRGSESEEDARSDSRRPKRTRDSAKNEK